MSDTELLSVIDKKFDEKLRGYKRHSWQVLSALIICFIIFVSGLFFNDHITIVKHEIAIKHNTTENVKQEKSIDNIYDLIWGWKGSTRGSKTK
jgi:hypothetical protein